MKKIRGPDNYFFSTARMIESAIFTKTGRFEKMPSSYKEDDNNAVIILDCVKEAMEKASNPIYIPRLACQSFMAIL